MKGKYEKDGIADFFSNDKLRLVVRHVKFGLVTLLIGLFLLLALIWAHESNLPNIPEYGWSALLSMPITVICMGVFSVFYEYYIRSTFSKSMRSMYWAWGTGVTVLPSHSDAPDRKDVLALAENNVAIMSTTFSQYFNDVRDGVDRKVESGVRFKFIVYDPESIAIEEKAKEENCPSQDFKDEITSTCRRYLGPLVKKYPEKVEVRFCNFNTPFGITIIDNIQMVLSLNIYGLARSKNETPCLIIENTPDPDSVFSLYKQSFDAVWTKLNEEVPETLKNYF